jgi:hypothetical protein
MTVSRCRQLTAIILLLVTLLAPLNSIAHDYASGAVQDTCICQLLSGDFGEESNDGQPGNNPCNNSGDCCDHEECCPDVMELPCSSEVKRFGSQKKVFHPNIDTFTPEVYLAIFVPPES